MKAGVGIRSAVKWQQEQAEAEVKKQAKVSAGRV